MIGKGPRIKAREAAEALVRNTDYSTAVAAYIAANPPSALTTQQLAAISAIDSKVDKVTGKVLSSNDYTDLEKTKLGHLQEVDVTGFVNTNDSRLSDARTPLAHSHSTALIVSGDKPTSANTTPVTLGISFNYSANKTYIIDTYAIVAPTAATTGCAFLLDVDTGINYIGTFSVHQLAATGTISGGSSIGDRGATAMGVSSGMVGTGSNYVTGSMLLITGANEGIATVYFRSETTAVTTCKSGSLFLVTQVN